MENDSPKAPRKIKGDLCSINDRSYLIMSWCGFCQRQGHFEDECFKKNPSLLSSDPAESMKTSSTSRVCGESPPKSTARAILESLLLEAVSWETADFSTSTDREKTMNKSKPKDVATKQNLAKVGNIENHRGKGSSLTSNIQAESSPSGSCCQPRDLSALRRGNGSSSSYAKPGNQKRQKKSSSRKISRKQANDAKSTHHGRGPKTPEAKVSRKNNPAQNQHHKRGQPNLVCLSSTPSPPTKSLHSTLPFRTQPSSNIEEPEPEPWYLQDPVEYPYAPEKGSESDRSSDSAPDLIEVSSPEAAPRPPQQKLDSEAGCGQSVAGTITNANTSDKPKPKSMATPKPKPVPELNLKLDETPVLIPVQVHRDDLGVKLGSRRDRLGLGLVPEDGDEDDDTDDDTDTDDDDDDTDTYEDTDEDTYDDTDDEDTDDDEDDGGEEAKVKAKGKGKGKGKGKEKEESESESESEVGGHLLD